MAPSGAVPAVVLYRLGEVAPTDAFMQFVSWRRDSHLVTAVLPLSRLEKRADMKLSTPRDPVGALRGKSQATAAFPAGKKPAGEQDWRAAGKAREGEGVAADGFCARAASDAPNAAAARHGKPGGRAKAPTRPAQRSAYFCRNRRVARPCGRCRLWRMAGPARRRRGRANRAV